LTCSGQLTHVSDHLSAAGRAQDRESECSWSACGCDWHQTKPVHYWFSHFCTGLSCAQHRCMLCVTFVASTHGVQATLT